MAAFFNDRNYWCLLSGDSVSPSMCSEDVRKLGAKPLKARSASGAQKRVAKRLGRKKGPAAASAECPENGHSWDSVEIGMAATNAIARELGQFDPMEQLVE